MRMVRIDENQKPQKAIEVIGNLQSQLDKITNDAKKFDNGNDTAGKRLRRSLLEIVKTIIIYRKEIQRIRYYREAWKVFHGQRNTIDHLQSKTKSFGSIKNVVEIQLRNKYKA